MCKKAFLFLSFLLASLHFSVAEEPRPSIIANILKLLSDSKEELIASKQETVSLRQELANSLKTISDMQITIDMQRQQLDQASKVQMERQGASKNDSTDSSELTISLQNLYNKSQTENTELRAENKARGEIIKNFIIAVIILSITTIGPWGIKLLRIAKVIPI
jgi:hypothetical protein